MTARRKPKWLEGQMMYGPYGGPIPFRINLDDDEDVIQKIKEIIDFVKQPLLRNNLELTIENESLKQQLRQMTACNDSVRPS